MKPFDLNLALAGDPVVTRDGRKVKIAGYNDSASSGTSLLGWIIAKFPPYEDAVVMWHKDGREFTRMLSSIDLFMDDCFDAEYYVNIYESHAGHLYSGSMLYKSKDKAVEKGALSSDYKTTVKIDILP